VFAEIERLRRNDESLATSLENARSGLGASLDEARAKVDSIFPPPLGDTLEVPGTPLVALARERSGLTPETAISSLTTHARYAMFETVFYESPAVAAKQRVYTPYLNRELSSQWPFLDLGCGRGEFLRILRGEGIEPIGVDINPATFAALRAEGFNVVEQDLLTFLEADRRTYSGASLLQVAEHLTDSQIERMLSLVASRLAPGAVFIVETPNPISVFALSVFHTDSTHVRPLPPERMRYEIEAAGFEQTRTLFQARIPRDQFAGPDPRAYYADYAIIASRSSP
jgi:O-antigen chain-terminating methyltransferase